MSDKQVSRIVNAILTAGAIIAISLQMQTCVGALS
jgi:hypothetical protein